MAKVIVIRLKKGQPLQLPQEAVDALGAIDEVHLIVDPVRRTVTIQADHPDLEHNAAIMDELAKFNEGLSEEEYGAPVPETFLHRRGKADQKDGE